MGCCDTVSSFSLVNRGSGTWNRTQLLSWNMFLGFIIGDFIIVVSIIMFITCTAEHLIISYVAMDPEMDANSKVSTEHASTPILCYFDACAVNSNFLLRSPNQVFRFGPTAFIIIL